MHNFIVFTYTYKYLEQLIRVKIFISFLRQIKTNCLLVLSLLYPLVTASIQDD